MYILFKSLFKFFQKFQKFKWSVSHNNLHLQAIENR